VREEWSADTPFAADAELVGRTIGRAVAPRVRERLFANLDHLRLNGVRQAVTVLFADIPHFASFSQYAQPDIVFEVLNGFLSLVTRAVLDQEGTLDTIMGHTVMALWNAPLPQPDHAERALRSASAIEQAVKAHRSLLDRTYRLYFSIGIATGEAVLGYTGANDLFNYSAIGETVDLAYWLESIADPGQILLSQATLDEVADRVIARELPPRPYKDEPRTVIAYELLGEFL
jgi:adenylate cyclase